MGQDQPRRAATVLESVEDLRAQIRSGLAQPGTAPTPATPGPDDAFPYRPAHRPSMAVLVIFDDGDEEGEVVRIRDGHCQIGRAEGDVLIPHDPAISGRHAEVVRRVVDGSSRWFLRDLGSSNGTFVRAARSPLQPGQELILGGHRYRFDPSALAPAEGPTLPGPAAGTQKWQAIRPTDPSGAATAALVEVDGSGDGRRHPLAGPEVAFGRDPRQCAIAIADPMLSPRHARFTRDDAGRWHVDNARSLNGVWLRVVEVPVERICHFLCGEQRFQLRIC